MGILFTILTTPDLYIKQPSICLLAFHWMVNPILMNGKILTDDDDTFDAERKSY